MGGEKQAFGSGGAEARSALDDPWAGGPPRWLEAPDAKPHASRVRPFLVTWLLLAAGMVIILLLALQSTDLSSEPSVVLVLAGATLLLAGACAWIIQSTR